MSFSAKKIVLGAFVAIATSAFAQSGLSDVLQSRLAKDQLAAVNECVVKNEPHKPVGRTSIFVRSGRTVTIGLQNDESIVTTIWDQQNPGDLVEDFVHPDQRNITLRLRSVGAVPGVITTTARRYFVLLVPTETNAGPCYQGVIFASSGNGFNPFGSSTAGTGTAAASFSEVAPVQRPDDSVFTGSPNFNYSIESDDKSKGIKPIVVYDNGRFTWIQFPKTNQALPAVFYSGPSGLEVVNMTPINEGSTILVNRLMDKFILKLGDAEVKISANRN